MYVYLALTAGLVHNASTAVKGFHGLSLSVKQFHLSDNAAYNKIILPCKMVDNYKDNHSVSA